MNERRGRTSHRHERSAVLIALSSAALFGASTPLARAIVGTMDPLWLAGLLYAGSGIGLSAVLLVRFAHRRGSSTKTSFALSTRDLPWLAAAVVVGGIIAPVLFAFGLRVTSAARTSLLLNLETVLTVVIAWFVFREHRNTRVVIGMTLIVASCVLLGWTGEDIASASWGTVLIALACLCWALDNNLTRKIAGSDATMIAAAKGACARTAQP